MNALARIFSRGRLTKEPPAQTAGRVLAPASVQRTQLGLRAIDPQTGIVTLRNGEVRAVLEVSGVPVHHRSNDDARRFLTGWAEALNALPEDAVYLMRSRPGGLDADITERYQRSTALAAGRGAGLARLQQDQLAHLRALQQRGAVRQGNGYVALRARDAAALLSVAAAARSHLERAGLTVLPLRDLALVRAIAESWKPESTQHWYYQAGTTVLNYAPGNARTREVEA